MIKNLIKLANHLDKKGFHKEADYVEWIIRKSSSDESEKSKAIGEINSFFEKLHSWLERNKEFSGPGQGHIFETIVRDFEIYLKFLKGEETDEIDMGVIDMMKREYPKLNALVEDNEKIEVVKYALEELDRIAVSIEGHIHSEKI